MLRNSAGIVWVGKAQHASVTLTSDIRTPGIPPGKSTVALFCAHASAGHSGRSSATNDTVSWVLFGDGLEATGRPPCASGTVPRLNPTGWQAGPDGMTDVHDKVAARTAN
jgi:hypothetical protein